jgi:hypothetical protein
LRAKEAFDCGAHGMQIIQMQQMPALDGPVNCVWYRLSQELRTSVGCSVSSGDNHACRAAQACQMPSTIIVCGGDYVVTERLACKPVGMPHHFVADVLGLRQPGEA